MQWIARLIGDTIQKHHSRIRTVRPREHLHQRAFTSSIFAHQSMHLTRQYLQIHMPKRDRRAKRLADALHRQTGSCGHFLLGHSSQSSQEHPLPPVKGKPHAIRQNEPA